VPAFLAAANTIRDQFQTQFHASESGVPVAFDNINGLYESDGSIISSTEDPYVALNIRPGNSQQASIGKRTWRNPGSIIVQVFVPEGTGDVRANEIAEAVAGALRGQTVDGVRFAATSPPQFVAQDGGWWQTNVVTQFEYDEIE